MFELKLDDVVVMRKAHPCGSDRWDVVRVGADIGLRCRGCGRVIQLPHSQFNKQVKRILPHSERSA